MTATRRAGGGRKATPTNLRVLRGNPGHRPINADEARAEPKLPRPPAELSDEAKREWRRTGRKLVELGLISELDEAAFAAYCSAYARWREAQQLLGRSGLLVRGADGNFRVNPLLRVIREAQDQFTRALVEFGMSPSSRARVKAAPKAPEADPFEEWERSAG